MGYFEGAGYPREPGEYRYIPFRGIGHYNLSRALASGSAVCRFVDRDDGYEFLVSSIPPSRVLVIERAGVLPASS